MVYHLHGRDTYPASLVLTEDDYLDFLVGISQNWDTLPLPVTQALADSSMLLGYSLHSWDFRTVFRGLITTSLAQLRPKSVSIQLEGDQQRQVYLKHYLDQEAELEVYWGSTQECLQELWQVYAGS